MNKDDVAKQMQAAFSTLGEDLSSLRTGRSNSSLVENIVVSAYGGAQRLKIMELASINSQDPTTLIISPWDKQVIGEINKAIMGANIGLSPAIDGDMIRLSIPPMTREDREKYVKILNTKLENGRIHIRKIRGDIMKEIKEFGESEDERERLEKDLQKVTDDFNEKISEIGEKKEKELLQV